MKYLWNPMSHDLAMLLFLQSFVTQFPFRLPLYRIYLPFTGYVRLLLI